MLHNRTLPENHMHSPNPTIITKNNQQEQVSRMEK